MLIRYTSPDGAFIRVKQIIVADQYGAMQYNCMVVPGGQFRTLPKVGLQFGLDSSYTGVSFYGNIHETYPDRREAQRVSTWYKSLADISAPQYVVPQEQGNREARWVRFKGDGPDITIARNDRWLEPLNFSVRRYNDTVVTAARRWRGLVPDPYYTVNIDHLVAPLGTATCGPGVAERHTISGDSSYCYSFIIAPGNSGTLADGLRAFSHSIHPDMQQLPPDDKAAALKVKTIACNTNPVEKYSTSFPTLLADERRAVPGDWQHGWAGFQSPDTVEFMLTLEEYATLGRRTCRPSGASTARAGRSGRASTCRTRPPTSTATAAACATALNQSAPSPSTLCVCASSAAPRCPSGTPMPDSPRG